MNHRSLLLLCAVSAGCLIFSVFAVTQLSHASQTAAKPASDPPANVVRTDYPDWPWPRGVHEPAKPDDGQLFHIPGSTKSYTDTQINRSTSTVDWFPELHPAPPAPVISGKKGAYNACGRWARQARHGRSSGTTGCVFSAATRRHEGRQAAWLRGARNRQ